MAGGSDIAVTKHNLGQYVLRMAHYLLNVQTAPQCRAFLDGFCDVIPTKCMGMFNQVRPARMCVPTCSRRFPLTAACPTVLSRCLCAATSRRCSC